MPLTNTLWYVPCHDQDAGQPVTGWGQPEVGVQDGILPPSCWVAEVVPGVAPSPGLHLTEQTQAEHRKALTLNTSGWTAVGAISGEGISPDGERTRVSLPRKLPHHAGCLPAETSLGLWPESTEGAQRETGRILGKPRGQLWKAPGSWVLLPISACVPWLCSSSSRSWQHVPQPPDQHRAHLCIAFCFPDQGHLVQLQYLSKLPKQLGWKLA